MAGDLLPSAEQAAAPESWGRMRKRRADGSDQSGCPFGAEGCRIVGSCAEAQEGRSANPTHIHTYIRYLFPVVLLSVTLWVLQCGFPVELKLSKTLGTKQIMASLHINSFSFSISFFSFFLNLFLSLSRHQVNEKMK